MRVRPADLPARAPPLRVHDGAPLLGPFPWIATPWTGLRTNVPEPQAIASNCSKGVSVNAREQSGYNVCSNTRVRSPVPELGSLGAARPASGNRRSYRD